MSHETGPRHESPEILKRFDATIVLGENIRKFLGVGYDTDYIRGRRDYLSPWSKRQALAAGAMQEVGTAGAIIFSSGFTAGEDIPSEARAMNSYMNSRFGFSYHPSILEERSLDTSTNAEELARIVKENDFKNLAVLLPEMHLKRTMSLLNYYFRDIQGITITPILTEKIIREMSRHYERHVRKLRFSPQRLTQDIQETIARLTLIGDPGGLRLRKRAEKERSRRQF